jgi:hypothetical protein
MLAPFARDEKEDILALMPDLTATVETWLKEGPEKAMNLHNRKPVTETGRLNCTEPDPRSQTTAITDPS